MRVNSERATLVPRMPRCPHGVLIMRKTPRNRKELATVTGSRWDTALQGSAIAIVIS
jgi:hypothetical protein